MEMLTQLLFTYDSDVALDNFGYVTTTMEHPTYLATLTSVHRISVSVFLLFFG